MTVMTVEKADFDILARAVARNANEGITPAADAPCEIDAWIVQATRMPDPPAASKAIKSGDLSFDDLMEPEDDTPDSNARQGVSGRI